MCPWEGRGGVQAAMVADGSLSRQSAVPDCDIRRGSSSRRPKRSCPPPNCCDDIELIRQSETPMSLDGFAEEPVGKERVAAITKQMLEGSPRARLPSKRLSVHAFEE